MLFKNRRKDTKKFSILQEIAHFFIIKLHKNAYFCYFILHNNEKYRLLGSLLAIFDVPKDQNLFFDLFCMLSMQWTTFFVESYNYYNWIFGKVHVGVFIGL